MQKHGAEPVIRPPKRMSLPRELRIFWLASIIAFVLAAVVSWLKWRAGQSVTNWNPLSDQPFGDLREYPGTYTLLHTRAFFFNVTGHPWPYPLYAAVAYPPLATALMAPIYLSGQPELVFLLLSAVWLVGAAWIVRGWLRSAGIGAWVATVLPLTLAATSFPIERLVHQGNIELVLWVLTATGVWAWFRDRNYLAAMLWGCAAAMKLFPFALFFLLLPRRKWCAFVVACATFILTTLWALWWLGPTIADAWRGSMTNVFGYQGFRLAEWSLNELVANHSLMNLAKLAALVINFPMNRLSLPYYAAGALFLAIVMTTRPWKLPAANQLLAVSSFMLMFPPSSYYPTLVHMYAPLAVLGWIATRAARAKIAVPGLLNTMLLFVPLFVPFPLLMYRHLFIFCGMVQSVVLLVLFFCAVQYRFEVPHVPTPQSAG
jgi:hypothetical protein